MQKKNRKKILSAIISAAVSTMVFSSLLLSFAEPSSDTGTESDTSTSTTSAADTSTTAPTTTTTTHYTTPFSQNQTTTPKITSGTTTSTTKATTTTTATTPDESETAATTESEEQSTTPATEATTVPTETTQRTTTQPPEIKLTLNAEEVTLYIGEQYQLQTTLSEWATDKAIRYYSLNIGVARSDQSGLITANGEGSVIITAINDYSGAFDTITVNVKKKAVVIVPAEIVTDSESYSISVGQKAEISASVLPQNAAQGVVFASSDTSVATVDEKGIVSGISAGNAVVTITTINGAISKTVDISVNEERIAENFTVDGYLYGQNGKAISGIKIFLDGTQSSITDISGYYCFENLSNTVYQLSMNVANKDYSISLAVNNNSTGYLFLKDGILTMCQSFDTIVPYFDIQKVEFAENSLSMINGESYKLEYSYLPSTTLLNKVEFESSNPSICTVGQDGTVTAKKTGSCDIVLRINDSPKTAICSVTVAYEDSSKLSPTIVIAEAIAMLLIVTVIFVKYRQYRKQHSEDEDM